MALVTRTFVIALLAACAACGAHATPGPAWPKMAETDEDGGESLAPHQPTTVATATEGDAEDEASDEDGTATTAAAPAPDASEATSAQAPDATTAPEQPIEVDDIVIEIGDDDE